MGSSLVSAQADEVGISEPNTNAILMKNIVALVAQNLRVQKCSDLFVSYFPRADYFRRIFGLPFLTQGARISTWGNWGEFGLFFCHLVHKIDIILRLICN
jgi:hypothetical protein